MLYTRLSVCQSNYDGLTQIQWARWELTTASAQLTSNSYNGDVRMLKVQHQTRVFTMRGESLKRVKLLVTTWTMLSITCALEWQTQSCSLSCTVQSKGEFTNSQSATVRRALCTHTVSTWWGFHNLHLTTAPFGIWLGNQCAYKTCGNWSTDQVNKTDHFHIWSNHQTYNKYCMFTLSQSIWLAQSTLLRIKHEFFQRHRYTPI